MDTAFGYALLLVVLAQTVLLMAGKIPHAGWLRLLGVVSVAATLMGLGVVLVSAFTIYDALFAAVAGFALINSLRLVVMRSPVPYLKQRVPRDAWSLSVLLSLAALAAAVAAQDSLTENLIGAGLAWLLLGTSLLGLWSVLRSRWHFTFKLPAGAGGQLPTLTIAIPARNEAEQLTDLLNSALSVDYDRLEVLVFDDQSQDATPELLGDFARRGVRFVQASHPIRGQLGKNHAYKVLAQEASGDYILFCGADVRLGRLTPRHLIWTMQHKKLAMVSLMPLQRSRRNTLRYQWQLFVPRILRRTPPVLSSVWAVNKQELNRVGGFKGVAAAIQPERYLARAFARRNAYRFYFAHGDVHAVSVKSLAEQQATEVRTLYPLFGRSLSLTVLTFGYLVFGLIVPLAALVAGIFWELGEVWLLTGVSALIAVSALLLAALSSLDKHNYGWLLFVPLAIGLQAQLVLRSLLQYEFSVVRWKGRDIAPVILGGDRRR